MKIVFFSVRVLGTLFLVEKVISTVFFTVKHIFLRIKFEKG